MKQLIPHIAYTVPATTEKWLEAKRALHALIVDEHERLRQRRSEIAALRHDLEMLCHDCRLVVQGLCQTWREQISAELQAELTKYNPEEPRVPARRPDGGEWTSEGGEGALSNPPSPQYAANDPPGRFPPPPPGYDPETWKQGQWPNNNKYYLQDPEGNTYTVHPEDGTHWRHWDKQDKDGNDDGRLPSNSLKPRAGQKRLNEERSLVDPNGDASPWSPDAYISVVPIEPVPLPEFPIPPVLVPE